MTRGLALVTLLAGGVLAAATGEGARPECALAAPQSDAASADAELAEAVRAGLRLTGEFGLWIDEMDGCVEVRWITERPGPGLLQVMDGDRVLHELATPGAHRHAAGFPRPAGRAVTLRYGAADAAERHETTLYPDQRRRQAVFSRVDSVYVVGDVHGEFDTLVRLLRNTGVVDEQLRWTAGRAHLVILGDLVDRGVDATRVLWFAYGLERQAERQGGRVHVVLGNHEIMVMLNDLRYVAPKELLIARLHGVGYSRLFDVRSSVLGRWLATKPALLKINRGIYAHGGLAPEYAGSSIPEHDATLDRYMRSDLFHLWGDSTAVIHMSMEEAERVADYFWEENSLFWFRGYVESDTLQNQLRRVLRTHRSEFHVVAHTPVPTIQQRYGGALVAVNVSRPASELLLLVGARGQPQRFRWGVEGTPEPLAPPAF